MLEEPIVLLTQLAYNAWASHRNSQKYWGTTPIWGDLPESEREWWVNYVKAIKSSFRKDKAITDNLNPAT